MPNEKPQPNLVTGALFTLILCGILVFGLWPFGHPRNDVVWVANQNAVRLGERATILSSGSLSSRPGAPGETDSCRIEMWLRPAITDNSATLLAFYGPRGVARISLHQSLSDLRLDNRISGGRPRQMYVNDVFHAGIQVFVGIVTGPGGTTVYVDGSPVRRSQGFRWMQQPCAGKFVVGDSPNDNDSWQGDLGGLAIFHGGGSDEQMAADYAMWRSDLHAGETAGSRYTFDEHNGRLIHDHGSFGNDLLIPERYVIAQQVLLESPVRAIEFTWRYVQDILINIGGFVPFGAIFYVFLLTSGWKRHPAAMTVAVGFFTSLLIETTQSLLPTRDSDLTDVLTNTLGTWLGVLLLQGLISTGRGKNNEQNQAPGNTLVVN